MFASWQHIKSEWLRYGETPSGKWRIWCTFSIGFFLLALDVHLINLLETRTGAALHDPFLLLFTPIDFSWPIFLLIYAVIFVGFYHLMAEPDYLIKGVQAYVLVQQVRLASIYFLPLEPPPGLIPLTDPLMGSLLSVNGQMVTKDLFFSGHTASIFVYYFVVQHRTLRKLILLCGIAVPIMLVWQHVHYTADVLAAPVIAFFCVKAVEKFYNLMGERFESKWLVKPVLRE